MAILAAIALAVLTAEQVGTEGIDGRLTAADPAKCLSRFLDYPPSKGKLGFPRCLWEKPFCPNPDFWLKDVDFSCASPWNDSCGAQRAGTLISKRHIVFAKHFPLWKGVRMLFVDREGEVCPCYIASTKAIRDTDIMIGALETEVAPNIHPAKILSEAFMESLPTNVVMPLVTFDQEEKAILAEIVKDPRQRLLPPLSQREPKSELHHRFFEPLIGGDSGNPAFLLVGKEPILLYCLRAGGTGYGPSVFEHRHEVQRTMDELCPGYKLEAFDITRVKGEK